MEYEMNTCLQQVQKPYETKEGFKYIIILNLKDWKENEIDGKKYSITSFEQISFCKLEDKLDYFIGTFAIPVKNNVKERKKFFCYIDQKKVIFVDDLGGIKELLNKMAASKVWRQPSIGSFIYTFLEMLIENDFIYLQEMENRLTKLEDIVLNGELEKFNHKMVSFRKELATWHNYYSQLVEIARKLEENENGFFEEEHLRLFKLFSAHVNSLQDSTRFLREYAIQVREVYQTQVDIKQNRIMEILTIVTTIFLPLTLITGWYGMNFENMPEIKWKYGYPAMILGSIIVVMICLKWFKDKKYI